MAQTIQTAIQKKKKAFYNWKCVGRPQSLDNFYLIEKKLTTTYLRKQIRIELAKQNAIHKSNILEARQSDNRLFHKLIQKQRGQCHKFIDELYVGRQCYSNGMV